MPEKFLKFYNVVFSGQDPKSGKCEKTRRLIHSVSQDICRSVINEEWKLPKYLLICLAATHPTLQIVIGDSNLVFHSELDNFN